MRLLELEIDRVRGIRHLLLKPDGQNVVVWGPNGAGKSAVVDAIDFLLTGRILRLTGAGTGSLSLGKHGPHIGCQPEDCSVRGVIQLQGTTGSIELKRSMAEPKKLICSKSDSSELDQVIRLAEQGVHILSRKEILKYITAEASTRAQEIQELLSITEIEETRKALVKVRNDTQKALEASQGMVMREKGRLTATTQDQKYEESRVLAVVNQNRSILGAPPVERLNSVNIKEGVSPPKVVSQTRGFSATLLSRDIQNLKELKLSENERLFAEADERLRELIVKITSAPDLMRALNCVKLITMGIAMIDATGTCPLCDTAWPSGKLVEHLKSRLEAARLAGKYNEEIGGAVGVLQMGATKSIASLEKVVAAAKITGMQNELAILEAWLKGLRELSLALKSPIESYRVTGWTTSEVRALLFPPNATDVLRGVEETVKKGSGVTSGIRREAGSHLSGVTSGIRNY